MRKLLCVVALLCSACGFQTVGVGKRGIETRFGEIQGSPLAEGMHFYNPFTSSITVLDVREQKHDGSTKPFTRDTQTATIHYTVVYAPNAAKIDLLYKTLGSDWAAKIVVPTVENAIQNVIGTVAADDLMGKREQVRLQAYDQIKTVLEPRDVTVTQLMFTNIDFEDAYEKAVEAKVVAVQKAAEARNHTVEVQEKANQQVIAAKAEAQSMAIRSQALSANQNLVQYEAVQKWDGKLPMYMMGGASVPFLHLEQAK